MHLVCILLLPLWIPFVCAGRESLSLEELDHISLRKVASPSEKNRSRGRILEVIENITYEKMFDIRFQLPLYNNNEFNVPFNTSILKTDGGYDLVCRTRTKARKNPRNYFLRYDRSFKLQRQQEITVPEHLSNDILHKDYPFADGRLFWWKGALWLTGWSYMHGTKVQKFLVGLLDKDVTGIPGALQSLTVFKGPDARRWEKNWMQVMNEDALRFIYSYDPFVLVAPNLADGSYETVLTYYPKLDFSHFRGSAAPIDFENGYLMMVHECLHKPEKKSRHYTHRFVYLDRNFVITKISLPFRFMGADIEFCLGMTTDHTLTKLVIPFGVHDREAKIMFLDIDYVKGLLIDIPH